MERMNKSYRFLFPFFEGKGFFISLSCHLAKPIHGVFPPRGLQSSALQPLRVPGLRQVVHLLLDQLPHDLIGVHQEHEAGGVQEIKAAPHLYQLVAASQAEGAVPVLPAEQGGRSADAEDAHLRIARRTVASSSLPQHLHHLFKYTSTGTARTGLLGSQRLPLFSSAVAR
jgi:hypothetical protein